MEAIPGFHSSFYMRTHCATERIGKEQVSLSFLVISCCFVMLCPAPFDSEPALQHVPALRLQRREESKQPHGAHGQSAVPNTAKWRKSAPSCQLLTPVRSSPGSRGSCQLDHLQRFWLEPASIWQLLAVACQASLVGFWGEPRNITLKYLHHN